MVDYTAPFVAEPFGTDDATASPDIGQITYLGGTVESFDASADWAGQSSTCSIRLIEDDNLSQKISESGKLPLVTSPQFFEVEDTGGTPVWKFNGILESIHRNTSESGPKTYNVVLENPKKILDAVTLVLDKFAGRGDVLEAIPPNVASNLEFGHNNSSVTWTNHYNLLNIFGAYENNDYGILDITDPTTGAGSLRGGFGLSNRNFDGMRATDIIKAIDVIVNRNSLGYYGVSPYGTPTDTNLGGNILYGTNDYNPSLGSPFHYGIDIVSFGTDISSLIPNFNDFRFQDEQLTLLDFIDRLCEVANADYYIDLKKFSDVPGVNFLTTYTGTVEGGMITITLRAKNTLPTGQLALSLLSRDLISKERPDTGDYPGGYPGIMPTGTGDNPLDYDWSEYYPTGSTPYGGDFPVGDSTDTGITIDDFDRIKNSDLGVNSTDAIAGRMVVGGFQSRMCNVPRDNIYHYWGELRFAPRFNVVTGVTDVSTRSVPVVTPLLKIDDIEDFIFIDTQSIFGDTSVSEFVYKGIYTASMLEIRCAMNDFATWMAYMVLFKPAKVAAIENSLGSGIRRTLDMLYDENGNLTHLGNSVKNHFTAHPLLWNDTSKRRINASKSTTLADLVNSDYSALITNLHAQIKAIGDEHYGKSWLVTMPAFTTKYDESAEAVVGNYTRSWDISNSAYIDPPAYTTYEAPQSAMFNENGRVRPYINYEANTTIATLTDMGITISGLNPFRSFDFREYIQEEFAYSQVGAGGDFVYHFKPESIYDKYIFLSSAYFSNYDRALFRPYGTTIMLGQQNSTLQSIIDNVFINSGQYLGVSTGISSIDEKLEQSGIGLLPFALVKTKRVYFNLEDSTRQMDANRAYRVLNHLLARHQYLNTTSAFSQAFYGQNIPLDVASFSPFPVCVPPKLFGVPQQSNKFVYGPWLSTLNSGYAGKIEYVQISDLSPENYIVPTAWGATSGLSGMNTVGQIEANAISNFDFFAEEDGSVTMPGFPSISGFGQSLVNNGPWINDLSVRVGAEGTETSYNFRTHAPRYDKINREIINQFRRQAKKRLVD